MKVKLRQAVKLFFSKSSLEMVYLEAVANAFDAGATEINIRIRIAAVNQPDTLRISISDNGGALPHIGLIVQDFRDFFDVDENSQWSEREFNLATSNSSPL